MDREDDIFDRFPDLPFELRSQIWEDAIPGPGIYPVELLAGLADDQDGHKALRLALRPAHHEFQDPDFHQRVRTHQTLLATCVESRAEVCRRFPNTLDGGGPRFSFRHDLVYIVSDLLHEAFSSHKLSPEIRFEFEGGWNKLIHRLALNCEELQGWYCVMRSGRPEGPYLKHITYMEKFMEFLTTCTSLKQLVLTITRGIGFDSWVKNLPREGRLIFSEKMTDCYGGLTCPASERLSCWAGYLAWLASLLRQLILNDLEGVIHGDWVR